MSVKDDVYTQNDLRRYNILTMDYVLNLEPGDFYAVLDLKAEARRCVIWGSTRSPASPE